ncbi:MAG TPA: alpha/beta fold hydrolase [Actinophytocola sp.]|jgi:ABC-2 type transport system ATP-binding protein|uniref:S15 peptidase family protein n=1 Tax=Actinophytocola sp. TaxID=1872138 RepID=UPI002DFD9410|nr:alpha/beta fold hydrolase [Actinophytocola sp.]
MRTSALLTAVTLLASAAVAVPTASADPAFTVQTLHFDVLAGPGAGQHCDIVGDLYTPSTATAAYPVPAILTTNGFGGSKDDQAGIARFAASNGYTVLSYSGLGFGGSGCHITLDDPDWDGRAASQLVSFLGSLDYVVHDAPGDPRVGMVGGSYGGGVQFATASVDPRVDTIIPLITWNDLDYSLGPNNAVPATTPGAAKITWALLFFFEGALLENIQHPDPNRAIGCPNFPTETCTDLLLTGTLGYPTPQTTALLRHASVASYVSRVRIPTLLIQGQKDTLFNLNEAVATYTALQARGTEVKMIWQSWGHSGGAAPGEIDLNNPDPAAQYETGRIMAWFDHYLKGLPADTGPEFTYFRDWISYTGNATPAYAASPVFPVGTARTLALAGGTQTFLTPPLGVPTSLSPFDAINQPALDVNLPGTFASWQSAAQTVPLDVVGVPRLELRLNAPTAVLTSLLGPAGQLVLFPKLYDVAPDGSASLIHQLVAPVRVADPTRPVQVTLPGIVHRFAPGHSVRLVVASGDLNYRGGLAAAPVTVTSPTLTLPVVS